MSQKIWMKSGERIVVFLLCMTMMLGSSGMYVLAEGLDSENVSKETDSEAISSEAEKSEWEVSDDAILELSSADFDDEFPDVNEFLDSEGMDSEEPARAVAVGEWHDENGLKWMIDEDGLLTIEDGESAPLDNYVPGWRANAKYIKNAKITAKKQTSMKQWFKLCMNLKSVDFSEADTSKVSDMSEMFMYCSNFESLDLSNLNTSSVTNMMGMFENCYNLKNLDLGSFDTSNVINMGRMFFHCYNLKSVDLGSFDSSNVVFMYFMFDGCESLENIDMRGFDTSKVTDMRCMFFNCHRLKSLNLSNYNTVKVENMSNMFSGCSDLETLDIGNFNTSNVIIMNYMFNDCRNLNEINGIEQFNTSNVTNMDSMFNNCKEIVNLDLSGFNTSKVTSMNQMFYGCSSLKNLNLKNFDTSRVNGFNYLFGDCISLEVLDIRNFTFKQDDNYFLSSALKLLVAPPHVNNQISIPYMCEKESPYDFYEYLPLNRDSYIELIATGQNEENYEPDDIVNSGSINGVEWIQYGNGHLSISGSLEEEKSFYSSWGNDITSVKITAQNITDTSGWFRNCDELKEVDVSQFNTSKVTNMRFMFQNCRKLKSLDLSNFNTVNVTDMSYMFSECNNLETVDISNFNTANVTNMCQMFYNCHSLNSIDVSSFDTSNVTSMFYIFRGCNNLKEIKGLNSFNTSNITDMDSMFYECYNLETLDVSGFNTTKVTNMYSMFCDCRNLKEIKGLDSFDTSLVTNMWNMFGGCYNLESIDVSSFYTDRVTNMYGMFCNCSSLKNIELNNFDTTNVTNMGSMFGGCRNLESLNLSNLKTPSVSDMSYMFSDCHKLSSLDLGTFNTSNVSNISAMFQNCVSLENIDLSNMNLSGIAYSQYYVFDGCYGITNFKSPKNLKVDINLPFEMYDSSGKTYQNLPKNQSTSITLIKDKPKKNYTVSFDGNGSESGSMSNVVFDMGVAGELPAAVFSRTGYEFTGWNTKANGSGKKYTDGQSVLNLTTAIGGSVTLYAQWKAKSYTLTLDAGEGLIGKDKTKNVTVTYDKAYPAFAVPVRKDFSFDGWYTAETGEANRISKEMVVKTASNQTLYARYVPVNAEMTLEVADLTYTGQVLKPVVTVLGVGNELLTEGVDYTVKYTNNTAANVCSSTGTWTNKNKIPTVSVTGKGSYTGSIKKDFQIVPMDMEQAYEDGAITVDSILLNETTKVQKAKPVVKLNGKALKLNVDYTLEYPEEGDSAYQSAREKEYPIIIRGKGNFKTGEGITVYEKITNQTLMGKMKYTVKDVTLTPADTIGDAVCPDITVKDGSKILKGEKLESRTAAEAYLAAYEKREGNPVSYVYYSENNTEVGTAKVTFWGNEKEGYTGEVVKNFKINGVKLGTSHVTLSKAKVTYNPNQGSQELPEVSVKYKDKNGEYMLVEDIDYTVAPLEMKKGSIKVDVIGCGKYAGKVTKSFTVSAFVVSAIDENLKVTLGNGGKIPYAKGGAVFRPEDINVVYMKEGAAVAVLQPGIDYSVSYSNNKAAWTEGGNVSKKPALKLTFKGNYSGTRTVNFEIEKKELSTVAAIAKDIAWNSKAGKYTTTVQFTDTDTKKLAVKTDYTINYYKGSIDEANGETVEQFLARAGEPLNARSVLNKETDREITVVATANPSGNYTGKTAVTYQVKTALLSSAKVSLAMNVKKYYDKDEINLSADELVVKIGTKRLERESEYKVTDYRYDRKTGYATIILGGVNEYGDTKEFKYKVNARKMILQ